MKILHGNVTGGGAGLDRGAHLGGLSLRRGCVINPLATLCGGLVSSYEGVRVRGGLARACG